MNEKTKNYFRILALDDHPMVLEGLAHMLSDYSVTPCNSSQQMFAMLTEGQCFDLFVLDLELPDADGFEALRQIRRHCPDSSILIYTMHDEPWVLARLARLDIQGAVSKTLPSLTLTEAVEAIRRGDTFFDSSFVGAIGQQPSTLRQSPSTLNPQPSGMSEREEQVLSAIANGMTTHEIADSLFISENTVGTYRRRLMKKFGAHNVAQLISKARRFMTAVLSAALLLSSCSENDYVLTPPASDGATQPIALSASISQQNVTRANEQGFVTGDRMGIFIVDRENGQPGALSATDNRASNMLYTFDGESYTWTSPTEVYWRDRETPVDIYGYYPGANYVDEPEAWRFSIQRDQSTAGGDGSLSGYEQSDLLWGKAANVEFTTERITVKYHHILAGVRVQLVCGDGISTTEWDKIDKLVMVQGTVPDATVNIATGAATVTGSTVQPVLMSPQSDDAYRAVVVPQTISAGKQLLSITIDGQAYSHTLTTAMQYQAGKLHNFTMTINKSEQTGDYTVSVSDDGISSWINDETSHQFSSMQYVVVNCPEMGKLKESITAAGYDYQTIQNLKVTGELTTEDFTLLREEMPELRHLNLKDVTITHAWTGHEFYDSNWHSYYADNTLPNGAFARNKYIRSLVLPSSLKVVGTEAFYGVSGLMYSTLEIPEGVTKIETSAFIFTGDCTSVELILPSTIDSIGVSAFKHCGFKCELNLSDNITYIGGGAFDGTPNFHGTFHIPSKLKQLDNVFAELGSDGSFDGEVEIPQGVTSVSGALGISMKKRVALNLPQGVKKIGRGWPHKGFTSIHFNDDLEEIGASCFQWYAMPPGGVTLPPGLVTIGNSAFSENGLEGEIVIPEGCLDIGADAFAGSNATKLVLPSKLEIINSRTFANMQYLPHVIIPKYVNYIGDNAFRNCLAMQTFICLNPEPPTLDGNPFHGMYFDKVILEVPEQSVDIYRHTEGWNQFQNITAYHELAFNIPEIVCLDKGTMRTGILRAEGDWEVSECPSWVTVSPSSDTYKDELTVTVAATSESREGRIVFRLKDKDYTTYTDVRQVYSADYREDQTVTLQEATAGATAIPLFLVGEGYGADDIASGQYLTDMREQMEHLFSTEPYKSYRNYFTVSTAYACSPQKGLGGLTKFDGNNEKVWQYARQYGTAVANGTAILVLCNTPAYGSHTDLWDNGVSFSWLGKNTDVYPYDQRGDVLHYFGGRGFGKLGPEYVNHFTFMKACGCPGCNMTNQYNWARQKGWWQNVSTTSKMTELPWYPFIFHEKYAQLVDVYEGALNHARSTYRPENQSVMGAVHVYYYNTISRYEIVKRIMQAAGRSITLDEFIANDKIELPE